MPSEEEYIYRYKNSSVVRSALDPLEDVICWIKGLSSVNYVKDILKSKHHITGNANLNQRSETIAKLVSLACKYLEQANNSPQEVSFLPLYYACLNLIKAYVAVGPHVAKLSKNRWHGATYNPNKDHKSLDTDSITLKKSGAIQLFYLTVTGSTLNPQSLSMGDIYPYIIDISAEYRRATGRLPRVIPFQIFTQKAGDKQRIVAEYFGTEEREFHKIQTGKFQGFSRMKREAKRGKRLVSKWYHKNDTINNQLHVHTTVLYSRCESALGQEIRYNLVPFSKGNMLFPEELPVLLAFYHMSNVVRYNPDELQRLMNSKYWPVLLVLRRQGLYKFLLLFWSFMNQTCTHIVTD